MNQERKKKTIIPEFYRDLKKSNTHPALYYFSFRKSSKNSKKPIPTPDNLPHKIDFKWDQIFDSTDHIEIEIGSGKGGFLCEYSKNHPEIQLLGSEWDKSWALFALRRWMQKKHHDNVNMLCGDMFYFVRDAVPDHSVNAYHMYFPDPWPKEKHHKNRLLKADFVKEVARTLKPGKRHFYWATDHQEYNEEALSVFDAFPKCTIIERNSASPTEGIMTGFEKKYIQEGRPIYRSIIVFDK